MKRDHSGDGYQRRFLLAPLEHITGYVMGSNHNSVVRMHPPKQHLPSYNLNLGADAYIPSLGRQQRALTGQG